MAPHYWRFKKPMSNRVKIIITFDDTQNMNVKIVVLWNNNKTIWIDCLSFHVFRQYYALINRARGPYEEIFVLTFKAYGPNAVRSMRLECQNKYFPYGPKSRLIRALLYTHKQNSIRWNFTELERLFTVLVRCRSVRTVSQPIRSKNSLRISISIQ